MVQYISKTALVAEIEKVIDEPAPLHDQQCPWEDGYYCGLYKAESIIDTLEVEEVDLEKELILWHKDHFKKEDTYEKYSGFYFTNNSQLDLAKHFFELGLKAKGK